MAIRILKAHLSQSAQSELSLYGLLLASAEREPSHAHSLVKLFTSFELIGPNGQHACFVFEVMGPNLSDMLRSQEFHVGHPSMTTSVADFQNTWRNVFLKECSMAYNFYIETRLCMEMFTRGISS